jgi:hypothetical protein
MRGFLIFLAVAAMVLVGNPIFWSIVNMQVGAERVGYVRDGVTQWATLGPLAAWPEWATVPEGGKLTVRANFEAAATAPATGFGEVELEDTSARGREAYVRVLEQSGWIAEVSHFDTLSPDLPPRLMHVCIVEAHKNARALLFSYDRADGGGVASLYWSEGNLPQMKFAKPGPC